MSQSDSFCSEVTFRAEDCSLACNSQSQSALGSWVLGTKQDEALSLSIASVLSPTSVLSK